MNVAKMRHALERVEDETGPDYRLRGVCIADVPMQFRSTVNQQRRMSERWRRLNEPWKRISEDMARAMAQLWQPDPGGYQPRR